MEIYSNFNIYPQKSFKNPSFGDRYPAIDIMCIMSSSEVIGKRSDTFEKTVAGVLRKPIGTSIEERGKDYQHAKEYLYNKYPNLRKLAQNYRAMLDAISTNHYAITTEDENLVTLKLEQQIGSKYFDIY